MARRGSARPNRRLCRLQSASVGDGERTTVATLALDEWRQQDLQRLHGEIAATADRQLTDSEAERRVEVPRTRESVH